MLETDVASFLQAVRDTKPLVLHITNVVTANDCANATLFVGGLPVMSNSPEEAEEMVGLAQALVLNIGTLHERQIEAMMLAGRRANERSIPIVLDPVGAGATKYRTETARRLLEELKITVLKGNAGEIATVAGEQAEVRGVESGEVAEIVRPAPRTQCRHRRGGRRQRHAGFGGRGRKDGVGRRRLRAHAHLRGQRLRRGLPRRVFRRRQPGATLRSHRRRAHRLSHSRGTRGRDESGRPGGLSHAGVRGACRVEAGGAFRPPAQSVSASAA